MAIKVSSLLKGHSNQPSNAYTTDEDEIIGLDDSTDLEYIIAEEEMYKEKYCQLREQVDQDEICNNLRAENTFLRNEHKELEGKVVEIENVKLSTEVQFMRREKEFNDINARNKIDRGVNDERNEALKLENKLLKKNEEYMKLLLLSHGIQTPALLSTPQATTPPTPELADNTDTDDIHELKDPLIVCSEWYNHGKCSRGDGTGFNKCKRGAHPRLVNFSTLSRP